MLKKIPKTGASINILIIFLLAFSIMVLFNSAFSNEFTKLNLYEGQLQFSADEANKNLQELITSYSNRSLGSEQNKKSAEWVKSKFENMSLNVNIQDFTVKTLNQSSGKTGLLTNVDNKASSKKCINVIATKKGTSDEVILIGAHRDVKGDIQGAEDNGSGTSVMLELARILSKEKSYYTYKFISFDGEEAGMLGSNEYLNQNKNEKYKLVYILDMVGYKKSDTIRLYDYLSSKGGTSLWAITLAKNVLEKLGMSSDNIQTSAESNKLLGAYKNFYALANQKIRGFATTDSSPFIDNNIDSIGIMTASSDKKISKKLYDGRYYHTWRDTTEQISGDVLGFSGKFSEMYIKSVELNSYGKNLLSKYYVVTDKGIIGNKLIFLFAAITFLVFIFLQRHYILNIKQNWKVIRKFKNEILKYEILNVIILTLMTVLFFLGFKNGLDKVIIILCSLAILLVSNVILSIFYKRFYMKISNENNNVISTIHLIYSFKLFLILLSITLIFNFFIAFVLVFVSILANEISNFISNNSGKAIIFSTWLILHLIISFYSILPYLIFNNSQIKGAVLLSLLLYIVCINYNKLKSYIISKCNEIESFYTNKCEV